MQSLITEVQIKSLEDKIYMAIMAVEVISEDGQDILSLGMGEMGEAREEAQRIVKEWMDENGIVENDTPVNTLQAVFTRWENGNNWVSGTIGEWTFSSKLFDEPSTFGINDGRVSKLSIYNDKLRLEKQDFFASAIVNYDRGWDIEPKEEHLPVFNAVMELLENAPKTRF